MLPNSFSYFLSSHQVFLDLLLFRREKVGDRSSKNPKNYTIW